MSDREKLLELLDSMFKGDCCVDKADAVDYLISNGVTITERCDGNCFSCARSCDKRVGTYCG